MIPDSLYSKIHKEMPILCVDIVVSNGSGILLIKRAREPEKGTWWFPGGRLQKGETLRRAAYRIVKHETNLDLKDLTYLGLAETQFDADPFDHGNGTHTVNAVYFARARETSIFNLALDDHHCDSKWISLDDIYKKDFRPYIKRYVALAEGVVKD